MATGFLAAACLSLVLSQSPSDNFYTNQRNHAIPVNVQESARAEIKEFLLYSSTDQGRIWQQIGAIPSSKNSFAFYAPGDGVYWFQVAFVNRLGVQDPDDRSVMKGSPNLKMVIDTLKPIMKSFQAQRHGDEIFVSWDVQEENPDLGRDGFRLEYQVKDGLTESWKPITVQSALKGQASFTPGHKQPLVVRLSVRDMAGNQSYGLSEVAGTVTAAGFVNPPDNSPLDKKITPVLPGGGISIPIQPLEPMKLSGGLPPPPTSDHKALFNPGNMVVPPPAPIKEAATDKVVADSRTPPPPVAPPTVAPRDPVPPPGGINPPSNPLLETKLVASAAPARKPLPIIQYVNQHQVKLQYEMKRVGPSGIGGLQIWLTKDDGDSWKPYAEVKDALAETLPGRQEREFEFRDKDDVPFIDGVYGLILVLKNRAGLGREPRPTAAPEIRIEIDTKPPVAQLYAPAPDPENPNQLLLKWSAVDKNLLLAPINLEYAEKRDGPWQPIKLDLENTGRHTNQLVTGDYSWKVPANTPVQVYLRLRVRDKADNESVAVTAEPQFVDLVEPEGALIGILPTTKRP